VNHYTQSRDPGWGGGRALPSYPGDIKVSQVPGGKPKTRVTDLRWCEVAV
jgi:hypothetical protein